MLKPLPTPLDKSSNVTWRLLKPTRCAIPFSPLTSVALIALNVSSVLMFTSLKTTASGLPVWLKKSLKMLVILTAVAFISECLPKN